MAKKRKSKKSINKYLVLCIFIILVVAVLLYFLYEPLRIKVNTFIDELLKPSVTGTIPENEKKGESELKIHYLDIGQGDSIFIELPDDTIMLIDSGNKSNEKANYIINYIKTAGYTDTIDYLMLTHSDADHVGNMVAILNAFEIKNAYVPDIDNKSITSLYKNFYDALLEEEKGGCVIHISLMFDEILSTNDTDSFFIAFLNQMTKDTLGSPYYEINHSKDPTAEQKNNVSPILLLEYMGKRAVFTGDAFSKGEEELVDNYNVGLFENGFTSGISINLSEVDILKVGHHGSQYATTEKFINLLKPKYSVISVGKNNYGHPTSGALERLTNAKSVIYRTDQQGTITATIFPDEKRAIEFTFSKKTDAENTSVIIEIKEIKFIDSYDFTEYLEQIYTV